MAWQPGSGSQGDHAESPALPSVTRVAAAGGVSLGAVLSLGGAVVSLGGAATDTCLLRGAEDRLQVSLGHPQGSGQTSLVPSGNVVSSAALGTLTSRTFPPVTSFLFASSSSAEKCCFFIADES